MHGDDIIIICLCAAVINDRTVDERVKKDIRSAVSNQNECNGRSKHLAQKALIVGKRYKASTFDRTAFSERGKKYLLKKMRISLFWPFILAFRLNLRQTALRRSLHHLATLFFGVFFKDYAVF